VARASFHIAITEHAQGLPVCTEGFWWVHFCEADLKTPLPKIPLHRPPSSWLIDITVEQGEEPPKGKILPPYGRWRER
jgi:hypothetical protein